MSAGRTRAWTAFGGDRETGRGHRSIVDTRDAVDVPSRASTEGSAVHRGPRASRGWAPVVALTLATLLVRTPAARCDPAPKDLVVELTDVPPDAHVAAMRVYVDVRFASDRLPHRTTLDRAPIRLPLAFANGRWALPLRDLPRTGGADAVDLVVDVAGAARHREALEGLTDGGPAPAAFIRLRVALVPQTTFVGTVAWGEPARVRAFVERRPVPDETGAPPRLVALASDAAVERDGTFRLRAADDELSDPSSVVWIVATAEASAPAAARVVASRGGVVPVPALRLEGDAVVAGHLEASATDMTASWLGPRVDPLEAPMGVLPLTDLGVCDGSFQRGLARLPDAWTSALSFGIRRLVPGRWRIRAASEPARDPVHPDVVAAWDQVVVAPRTELRLGAFVRSLKIRTVRDTRTTDGTRPPVSAWVEVAGEHGSLWLRTDADGRARATVHADRGVRVAPAGAGGSAWAKPSIGAAALRIPMRRGPAPADDVVIATDPAPASPPWERPVLAFLAVRGTDRLPLSVPVRIVEPDGTVCDVTTWMPDPSGGSGGSRSARSRDGAVVLPPAVWPPDGLPHGLGDDGRARVATAAVVRVSARGRAPATGAFLEVGGAGFSIVRLPLPPGPPIRAIVTVIADAPKNE